MTLGVYCLILGTKARPCVRKLDQRQTKRVRLIPHQPKVRRLPYLLKAEDYPI